MASVMYVALVNVAVGRRGGGGGGGGGFGGDRGGDRGGGGFADSYNDRGGGRALSLVSQGLGLTLNPKP